jgi:two-component system sensor histidine kinase PhcS
LHATEDQLIAQQKHQALSHMASGLLHELLNPINSATQALNFAKTMCRDKDLSDVIEDALFNQNRIVSIITDLRAFAQDSPATEPERASLEALISQSIKLCAAELTGISVTQTGAQSLSLACYPNALTQVMVNLLLNAAHALSERKKMDDARIQIRVQREDGLVRIDVEDNGKGIAPDHLKRLAEPFYSADKESENMGLGLSICQTILRHHDGRLWVKSEQGRWTTVSLEMPLR